jgi:hypothetical protein
MTPPHENPPPSEDDPQTGLAYLGPPSEVEEVLEEAAGPVEPSRYDSASDPEAGH